MVRFGPEDTEIENEILCALSAREMGNEGKSRVCARRAAGIAIRKYATHSVQFENMSSYEIIQSFAKLPNLPQEIVEHAKNLTLRVSSSFRLPDGVDLIRDASHIYEYLLDNNYQGHK